MAGLRLRELSILPVLALLFLLQLCLVPALAADRQQGLLWEISGQGGQVSYLFGTIHSDDPAVLKLAAPVQDVFKAADAVVVEALLDMDAMLYSSKAMLLADGRLLSQITGQDLFAQTAGSIAARGIPAVVLEHMKPWAAAVTLSIPAQGTGMVLDRVLYERALQAGKPVHGLETIREQLAIFDELPEDRQLDLLRDAVENFPDFDAMYAELLAAWRQRDLDHLLSINKEMLQAGDRQFAADIQERVVTGRNHVMAERMEPYLKAGNAFVAVGALHLPGKEGLLALLRQRGYSVRAIY